MKPYLLILFALIGIIPATAQQFSEKAILEEQLFIQAEASRALDKCEEALDVYNELRKKQPRNIAVLYGIARCELSLGNNHKAETTIDNALIFEPNNLWLLDFKLKLLEKNKNFTEAPTLVEKIFILTKDPAYLDRKAYFLAAGGQYKEAYEELDRLEKIVNSNKDIALAKSDMLILQNKPEEAIQELINYNNNISEDPEIMHKIAAYYNENKQADKSIEWYQKIYNLDNNDPIANFALFAGQNKGKQNNLAGLSDIISNPQIAVDLKIAELVPHLAELMENRDPMKISQLDTLTRQLASTHRKDPKVHALRGDVLYHSGKITEAIQEYHKTIKLTPSNFQVWRQLMQAYEFTGGYSQLLTVSEDALSYYPNQSIVYYYNGLALYHNDKINEASSILDEGLLMTGRDKENKAKIIALKAAIQIKKNNEPKAVELYNQALKENPADIETKSAFAKFLTSSGTYPDKNSLNELKKSALNNPIVCINVVDILLLLKDIKEAENILAKSVEKYKYDYPLILEKMGDFKLAQGKKDEALTIWKEASYLMPNNKTLAKKLVL